MADFSSHDYVQDYEGKERLYQSNLELAKDEGLTEGERNKSIEIAKSLIGKLSLEEISEVTKLTIEEIKSLKEN